MANFNNYIPFLKRAEGGYQKLSGDSGNYNSLGQLVGTNHGISAAFYEDIIKRPPTEKDMRNISLNEALNLYKIHFWDKVYASQIDNQSIANIIVDHAINAGEGSIARIVQRILKNDFNKNINIDGDIGIQTVTAINSVNQKLLFDKIKIGREDYYNSIGGEFLDGWLNRLELFVFQVTQKKKK